MRIPVLECFFDETELMTSNDDPGINYNCPSLKSDQRVIKNFDQSFRLAICVMSLNQVLLNDFFEPLMSRHIMVHGIEINSNS